MKNNPQAVPENILQEIALYESNRLNNDYQEELEHLKESFCSYFPDYSTDCVGYSGPLVVVVWAGSSSMVSTFVKDESNNWKISGNWG
jgi:hypothetical protein